MPSDPSGVSPKGVLVRPAPDFFDDHLAVGYAGTIGPQTGLAYVANSLFNDGTVPGQLLKVYGIGCASDGDIGCLLYAVHGTFGSFFANPINIRFDQPAPPGQLFQNFASVGSAADPSPFSLPPPFAFINNSGFTGSNHFSPFPLAIIPVGYSLVCVNDDPASDVAACFWYHFANE